MKKGQIIEGMVECVEFPNKGIVRTEDGGRAVSYTHLDVYKRQGEHGSPEVKQHVQKERVIDAAAAVADIA